MYINLHTHHPTLLPGAFEIESVYFGQPQPIMAFNRSAGLHPWHLGGVDLDAATRWLNEQAALPNTLAIGEAGLDKVCPIAWDLQVSAFQRCVDMAETHHKPLIIHCVRAYAEILALKKTWKPLQPWIFHGFEKKQPTADMLLRAGCHLSFGAALLRENSPAIESLRTVPTDRFFLETDDSTVPIEAVYERAASIRGITVGALQEMMAANFSAVVGTKAR